MPGHQSSDTLKFLDPLIGNSMKYIELFAGCGGLSLGLESLGYELLFANELSPMASETFAYNILNEDLSLQVDQRSTHVKWISSNFSIEQRSSRLRENPQTFPKYSPEVSDLPDNYDELKGSLLVGSIIELNRYLKQHPDVVDQIRNDDVDLVSGGPPCQSFSMAGLRQVDNHRNSLPMDFAEFVSITKPKTALLENVSGILRAFKLDGSKYYAWFEVARAFASKGYYPICLHVNAKYAGAAQNRPRFILIAIREDIYFKVKTNTQSESLLRILEQSESFIEKERGGIKTEANKDLTYFDIEKDPSIFSDEVFSSLHSYKSPDEFFSVEDAIGDLKGFGTADNRYARMLNDLFLSHKERQAPEKITNHQQRENSVRVRMRFMLYQYVAELKSKNDAKLAGQIAKDIGSFLKAPEEHVLSDESIRFLLPKSFLADDGRSRIVFSDRKSLTDYLSKLGTKKQTQRALIRSNPAPAALSIPDDACHYDQRLQRTLTVREMARFQSFPDWFEFKSKVTTGGKMRRFEVPQYTQVGNAVPPMLGRALGKTLASILKHQDA